MLKKRVGAALLSLCLALGLCTPAYALEEEAPPEAASRTEAVSPDPYALTAPAPGAALLALPRAGDVVDSGTCGAEGNNLAWTLDSEGTLTISGEGAMEDYFPYDENGMPVLTFGQRLGAKALVVEEGVTSIGEYAFFGSVIEGTAHLPSTLKQISSYAFADCANLQWIDIPDGVTTIEWGAFEGCEKLHTVHLPESLTAIPSRAFATCYKLRAVDIPGGVTSIGDNAFEVYQTDLEKVYFSGTEEEWNSLLSKNSGALPSSGVQVLFQQRTIRYDPNGGTDNMWNGHAASGESFRLPACGHKAPAGQVFNGWRFDGGVYWPGDSLTFTENAVVTALWRSETAPAFSVSVTGSLDDYPGTGTYEPGTRVTLRAGTPEDRTFTGWTVEGVSGLTEADLQSPDLTFPMPENAVTAEAGWEAAEPIRGALTKEEIQDLLRSASLTIPGEVFDEEPSLAEPYRPGKVSASALNAALNRLNALRALAGLPAVALDDALNENAQYGALAMAHLGTITHYPKTDYPEKFAQLPEDIQTEAAAAASSSNLSAGRSLTWAVDGLMDDSDSSNIDRLGHRRWQLNPAMGKVGFGYAANPDTRYGQYVVEKVFDSSGTAPDYEFVGWPAAGYFPSGLGAFHKNTAWSVSLNPAKYQTPVYGNLTVTLTGGGKTWTFDKAAYDAARASGDDSNFYFNLDTGGYGVANCIIFRPDGVESYEGLYKVQIDGLKDKNGRETSLTYEVEFFDPFLTVAVSGSYADPNGAGEYEAGDSVTVRAGTREGWIFDKWTVTGVDGLTAEDLKNPDLTFPMPENDVTAAANWKRDVPLYAVTVTGSNAAESGAGSYEADAVVTLHAGTREGWVFDKWTVTGMNVSQANLYRPDFSFFMPANDVTASASWKKAGTPSPALYSVRVTGSYAAESGSGDYEAGTRVTLHAGTRPGWTFDSWAVRGLEGLTLADLQNPDFSFTMPENIVTATANWTETGGGSFTVSVDNSYTIESGAGSCEAGTRVTLHAGTRPGWTFDRWTVTGVDGLTEADLKNPDLTFTMPGNGVAAVANWRLESGGVPEVPVTTFKPGGFVTTVYFDYSGGSSILDILGKPHAVFAALVGGDGRQVTGAARGEIAASAGNAVFRAELKPNDKLYFLDPDTLVPLAKPTELK